MANFTETTIAVFGEQDDFRIVQATGQDVVINIWNGVSFESKGETITSGTSKELITKGAKFQFVIPAGGSFYVQGHVEVGS